MPGCRSFDYRTQKLCDPQIGVPGHSRHDTGENGNVLNKFINKKEMEFPKFLQTSACERSINKAYIMIYIKTLYSDLQLICSKIYATPMIRVKGFHKNALKVCPT